ncbi:hypothetical protein [Neisseria sicca]|uniref:hypothetical protein n=1 Tax=Neisseria sicca TaxID=490 RepID=UPI001900EC06|nr:hypothetical protein [Neisseria sicca]
MALLRASWVCAALVCTGLAWEAAYAAVDERAAAVSKTAMIFLFFDFLLVWGRERSSENLIFKVFRRPLP